MKSVYLFIPPEIREKKVISQTETDFILSKEITKWILYSECKEKQ